MTTRDVYDSRSPSHAVRTPSDAYDSRSPTPHSSGSSEGSHRSMPSQSQPASPTTQDPLLSVAAHAVAVRTPSYIQSPLNPHASRPESRASISRIASEDMPQFFATPSRPSMLLYRLASDDPFSETDSPLPPPIRFSRYSIASDSGQSAFSVTSDSKYPSNTEKSPAGAFLPYAYDPTCDQSSPPDADDILHDPAALDSPSSSLNLRGLLNVLVLVLLILAILCLFTTYPILSFIRDNSRNLRIDNNIQVNATGQVASLPNMPALVDKDTPDFARQRTGFDGNEYELVFSDEFNAAGRTFYPGDDPYWEAVDLWYGATADLEWYDPGQIITADGKLRIRIEQADPTSNHQLSYKSGMLQSWNKFCFSGGYIEVSVSFPGANSNIPGYWPGVWIMGNLARPGYGASTDGLWPYSYNSCDLGTFPNQTTKDKSGPSAALHTDFGRDKYNFELSWLPGQRLSACTCPGNDHPGPSTSTGRGAPEIDILEAQKNKLGTGGKVSQSAQFAPFNHDYVSLNGTGEAEIYNPAITKQNSYQGSALQQATSALTTVPDTTYAGTGGNFTAFGFEYYSDPANDASGYITWQVDGTPSYQITAAAVPADPLTQISQRLIAVEPMSIVLNLGMSESFQPVDIQDMTFPADFLIDYIRVYQQKGRTNYGCDPKDYPTSDYIARHMNAYTNPNLTSWADAGYMRPRNSQYDGC